MGHALAIVSSQGGTEDKIMTMEAAGLRVAASHSELGTILDAIIQEPRS